MKFIFILSIGLFSISCSNNGIGEEGLNQTKPAVSFEKTFDYSTLPFKNENGNITAVIEIPAGTNHKYEYNYSSKSFECEIRDGKPRVVNFLPYVGSYGFIPGTYMDPKIGGDGDALDILIIGESIQQGEIVEIQPIATLKLLDGGEEDHKVIGVPINNDLNVANITDYASISDPIKSIIQTWFCSYKGPGEMKFLEWVGTEETNIEIKKWIKK